MATGIKFFGCLTGPPRPREDGGGAEEMCSISYRIAYLIVKVPLVKVPPVQRRRA